MAGLDGDRLLKTYTFLMEGEMVAGAFGALGIMGETSLTKK